MIDLYPLPIADGAEDKLINLIEMSMKTHPQLISSIVDGGAGIGDTTRDFLRISPKISVWAYEPLAENVKILTTRFKGVANVIVRDVALNKENTPVWLYTPSRMKKQSGSWGVGSSYNSFILTRSSFELKRSFRRLIGALLRRNLLSDSVKIESVALDTEPVSPDIIKLDLQGGELDALVGASTKLDDVKIVQVEQLLIVGERLITNFDALKFLTSKLFFLHIGAIQFETKSEVNEKTLKLMRDSGFTNIRQLKGNDFSSSYLVICNYSLTKTMSLESFSKYIQEILEAFRIKYVQFDVIGIRKDLEGLFVP
jgi:FkbM family methyltransferase